MAIVNPKASPLDPSVPGGMDSLPISNICGIPVCDSDIDEPIVIVPTSNTRGREYVGTSETDKPMNVQQYSIYHELDTGKNYYYDNGQWNEIPCCSGGGGSSDFSTAKATVKNNSAVMFEVIMPNLFSIGGQDEAYVSPSVLVPEHEEAVFDVILYKNDGQGYINTNEFSNTVTVSGDAEYDVDGTIDYTGDFTITYSGS